MGNYNYGNNVNIPYGYRLSNNNYNGGYYNNQPIAPSTFDQTSQLNQNSWNYGNLLNNTPYNNYMGNNNIQQQQQSSNFFLRCKPVSSEEQARACSIDLDGSLWVFTDIANQKIYTKQIDMNGLANFNTYELISSPEKDKPVVEKSNDKNSINNKKEENFITRDEFNQTLETLVTAIKNKQDKVATAEQSNQQKRETLLDFN